MQSIGISLAPRCCLCDKHLETTLYLLSLCPFASSPWQWILSTAGIRYVPPISPSRIWGFLFGAFCLVFPHLFLLIQLPSSQKKKKNCLGVFTPMQLDIVSLSISFDPTLLSFRPHFLWFLSFGVGFLNHLFLNLF